MRIFLVHLYSLYFLFEQMIWGPMSETRVEIEPFVAAGIRLLFLSLSFTRARDEVELLREMLLTFFSVTLGGCHRGLES